MSILIYLSAAVILSHCILIASRLSRRKWQGHVARYFFVTTSYSLIAGGALGAALGWTLGCELLIIGMAVLLLSERRGTSHERGAS